MNLEELTKARRWTPRAEFPASEEIGEWLFACGQGFYLMTNPMRGDGDPVRSVGWAESDRWARRAWVIPYTGDLQTLAAQWDGPPALGIPGPRSLSFGDVLAFERARLRTPDPTLVSARYRLTDGAFLFVEVNGDDGNIVYHYAATDPKPVDQPVAIEFKLPERR